jgi:hypothetical protein
MAMPALRVYFIVAFLAVGSYFLKSRGPEASPRRISAMLFFPNWWNQRGARKGRRRSCFLLFLFLLLFLLLIRPFLREGLREGLCERFRKGFGQAADEDFK